MEWNRPASNAKLQAAITQQVDRCALFSVADRMPERQEVDGNAQADALCPLGNSRGNNQRR